MARLVGGSQPNEGRVELYYNNAWGSVCSNSWDITEANVVCKMLGYSFAIRAWAAGQFGEGNGTTSVYRPQCIGTESNITECSHSGWGTSCSSSRYRDLGAECTGEMYILLKNHSCIIIYTYTSIHHFGKWRRHSGNFS